MGNCLNATKKIKEVKAISFSDKINDVDKNHISNVKSTKKAPMTQVFDDMVNDLVVSKSSIGKKRFSDKILLIKEDEVNINDVKILIHSSPEVLTITNKFGLTSLHVASKLGKLDVVKLLIEMGSDVNAKTKEGNTPLHYAIGYNHFDCAMILQKNGAKDDLTNNAGFEAKRGIDGQNCYGIAALFEATKPQQAIIAFQICLDSPDEVDRQQFLDASSELRKKLVESNEWNDDLERSYQTTLTKINDRYYMSHQSLAPRLSIGSDKSISKLSSKSKESVHCRVFCFA